MTEFKYLADTGTNSVIDTGAVLGNGVRATADYTNDTELDLYCTVFLTVQWNSDLPTAGDKVAELYILPGAGEGTEVFPTGGVTTRPQQIFLVGAFESVPEPCAEVLAAFNLLAVDFQSGICIAPALDYKSGVDNGRILACRKFHFKFA